MADGVVMPPEEDLCRARLVPLRYLSQQLRRTVADYLDPTVGMRQCYKQLAQYLLDYNDVRITVSNDAVVEVRSNKRVSK